MAGDAGMAGGAGSRGEATDGTGSRGRGGPTDAESAGSAGSRDARARPERPGSDGEAAGDGQAAGRDRTAGAGAPETAVDAPEAAAGAHDGSGGVGSRDGEGRSVSASGPARGQRAGGVADRVRPLADRVRPLADRVRSRRFPVLTRDTARPEGGGRAMGAEHLAPYRQWPLLAVCSGVLLGLLVTVLEFRTGSLIIGLSLLGGCVMRWMLPSVGMLAVRSRFTDLVTYGVLGGAIVLLAMMAQPSPWLTLPFLEDVVRFLIR